MTTNGEMWRRDSKESIFTSYLSFTVYPWAIDEFNGERILIDRKKCVTFSLLPISISHLPSLSTILSPSPPFLSHSTRSVEGCDDNTQPLRTGQVEPLVVQLRYHISPAQIGYLRQYNKIYYAKEKNIHMYSTCKRKCYK